MLNFCSIWDFQLAQCLFSRQNKMLAVIEIQVSGLILFCWWKLFSINLGNHTCHAIIAITHQTSRACSRNHCKTWKVAMMESFDLPKDIRLMNISKHYGCQFFLRTNSIFLWNGILAALSELCFETPGFGLHSEETGKIFQAEGNTTTPCTFSFLPICKKLGSSRWYY